MPRPTERKPRARGVGAAALVPDLAAANLREAFGKSVGQRAVPAARSSYCADRPKDRV